MRIFPQFSLRLFFVLLTLVIVLGWLISYPKLKEVHREGLARSLLQRMIVVVFDERGDRMLCNASSVLSAEDIQKLPDLRIVVLNGTKLDAEVIHELCNLTHLEGLALSNTTVSDIDLDRILQRCSGLVNLYIENTHVTDSGLKQIRRLPRLRYLALTRGDFSPETLESLRTSNPRLQIEEFDLPIVDSGSSARVNNIGPGAGHN